MRTITLTEEELTSLRELVYFGTKLLKRVPLQRANGAIKKAPKKPDISKMTDAELKKHINSRLDKRR